MSDRRQSTTKSGRFRDYMLRTRTGTRTRRIKEGGRKEEGGRREPVDWDGYGRGLLKDVEVWGISKVTGSPPF